MKLREIKVGLMLLLPGRRHGRQRRLVLTAPICTAPRRLISRNINTVIHCTPDSTAARSVNGRDWGRNVCYPEHDGQLEPCISPSLFDALQLKDAQWPTAATCLRFSQIDKAIGWEYDSGKTSCG